MYDAATLPYFDSATFNQGLDTDWLGGARSEARDLANQAITELYNGYIAANGPDSAAAALEFVENNRDTIRTLCVKLLEATRGDGDAAERGDALREAIDAVKTLRGEPNDSDSRYYTWLAGLFPQSEENDAILRRTLGQERLTTLRTQNPPQTNELEALMEVMREQIEILRLHTQMLTADQVAATNDVSATAQAQAMTATGSTTTNTTARTAENPTGAAADGSTTIRLADLDPTAVGRLR